MTAEALEVGQRVRVQLPNWDGPGCIVYTIRDINAERRTATMNAPKLPGAWGARSARRSR
jgi:hypothetical protein